MKKLKFRIYSKPVDISSENAELIELISKDFSWFLSQQASGLCREKALKIEVHIDSSDLLDIPKNWRFSFKRRHVWSFDQKNRRLNYYPNEATCLIDYQKKVIVIKSRTIARAHELTYLCILSMVGKALDLEGVHRIHSCSFVLEENLVIVMGKMGVGKSTLLSQFLNEKSTSFYSDDMTLIDQGKTALAFPVRIGLSEASIKTLNITNDQIYKINRAQYGEKNLLDVTHINNSIGGNYKNIILINATRVSTSQKNSRAKTKKISKVKMFFHLLYHSIIGFGLPMIFEVFWRVGPLDFLRKTKIFCLRLVNNIYFLRRADTYEFNLSENHDENKQRLMSIIRS